MLFRIRFSFWEQRVEGLTWRTINSASAGIDLRISARFEWDWLAVEVSEQDARSQNRTFVLLLKVNHNDHNSFAY